MPEPEPSQLRPDDPNSNSILLVGAIGTLVFVSAVCFASGLYYGLERKAGAKAEVAKSPLLETTVTEVRVGAPRLPPARGDPGRRCPGSS